MKKKFTIHFLDSKGKVRECSTEVVFSLPHYMVLDLIKLNPSINVTFDWKIVIEYGNCVGDDRYTFIIHRLFPSFL